MLWIWRPQEMLLPVRYRVSTTTCITPFTNASVRARTHPLVAEEGLPGIALRPRLHRDLGCASFQLCDEAAHTQARAHTHVRMRASIREIDISEDKPG